MTKNMKSASGPEQHQILITRSFAAPIEKVWDAWTNPETAVKWWGPKDWTSPEIKIDLHEGGTYLFCMRSPEGKDFWSTGTYEEIIPMIKLVFTDSFSDEKGNIMDPVKFGMDLDFPRESKVEVTFDEQDDNVTKLEIKYLPESEKVLKAMVKSQMKEGWNESLDKLASVLNQ
jgi:uncharacterized protein YndB with AHSA1/START domain